MHHFFGQSIAKAHDYTAVDLSFKEHGIDSLPYIMGSHIFKHFYLACFFIDFDFYAMNPKRVGHGHIPLEFLTQVFIIGIIKMISHEHGSAQ